MNINICFHGIGVCTNEREPGEAAYWVSEDVFLGILDAARERPRVRLSFDDGNRSDVEVALPALRTRGLDAEFFALAGRLDDPASLNPADLRSLRAAGMRIGSHGWAHVPWRRMSAGEVRRELDEARTTLAAASDGEIDTAAFPLGRYDRPLLGNLKKRGYTTVYSSDRFPARSESWLQARYSVTAGDTVESVRRIMDHTIGLGDARNVLASVVKRLR
ncbi:MAG TPA: polysaccharide deacetylase family protein [Microbacterium sp.]|uniref:polysaccharide deacetylase family protein n=1 Tax=Microbacterium sp. TaxID=51671 RepID=UPI002C88A29B|nr:polysaccharide deacetylase family protein [Microbacterium sp.]HWI31333.1 polysaccharide deacetylase family protein [Microbacterium sp.]